jgi:hypothetical protein
MKNVTILKKVVIFLGIIFLGIIGLVIADQIDFSSDRSLSQTNTIGTGTGSGEPSTASVELAPSKINTKSKLPTPLDENIDGVQSR